MSFIDDILSKNIFFNPKPDSRESYFIGALLLFLIVFLIAYLAFLGNQANSGSNFGEIYFYLTVIILIFITLALISRFQLTAWVFYGKAIYEGFTNFKKDGYPLIYAILAGLIIGIFLHSSAINFSIAVPFVASVATTSVNSVNNLLQYFVVSYYAPIIEEVFWIGIFVPSMLLYAKGSDKLQDMFTGAIILSFLIFFFGVIYFGMAGIIIGLIMLLVSIIVLSIIYLFLIKSKNKNNDFITPLIVVMIIGDMFMTALHIFADGSLITNLPTFEAIFLFFFIEGVVDVIFQSIIPSIIIHSVNNSIVAIELLNISPKFLGIPTWIYMVSAVILTLYSVGITAQYQNKKSYAIKPLRWFRSYEKASG